MRSVEKRTEAFFIDIEKVISDKNPRLLKILPAFLIRYLKKIIHQDEFNEFLKLHGNLTGLDFIHEGLKFMETNYEVIGLENFPKDGRYLFVSNHPLGGLDGLVFIHEIGKIWPELKFPVNDLLMNIKNLDPIFLPINKHGKQDKQAVRRSCLYQIGPFQRICYSSAERSGYCRGPGRFDKRPGFQI